MSAVLEFGDGDDGPSESVSTYSIDLAFNGYILTYFSDEEGIEYKYVFENKDDLIGLLKEIL